MPLQHSSTDAAFKTNVRSLMHEVGQSPHVQSPKQALAIAYSIKRRPHRAGGGMLSLPMTGGQGLSTLPNYNMTGRGAPWTGQSGFAPEPSASAPPSMPSASSSMNFPHAPIAGVGNGMPAASPQNPMPAPTNAAPQCRQFGGLTKPPSPSWTVKNEARSMLHSGPITSAVPGRTDRHNVSVGSGAYVMPADAVSHLGQNNTKAGQTILSRMFGGSGPYGMGHDMALKHGAGAPKPPAMRQPAGIKIPKFSDKGGGRGEDHIGQPVPIVVAGGEFTIPPEIVAKIGGGDIKHGHKVLDDWVLKLRRDHIKTLRNLPGPAKA